MSNKVEYLVVDTSAFIKNVPLQEVGDNILTEQSVINEITNRRQLKRLVVLPYDLVIKDVFPEHINFVTEFAKKTGDYMSLSATDIKVMALTYQLEVEKVGKDHLKTTPAVVKTLPAYKSEPLAHPKSIAGFYLPKGNGSEGSEDEDSDEIDDQNEIHSESKEETDLAEKFRTLNCKPEDLELEDGADDVLVPVKTSEEAESSSEDQDEDVDDEEEEESDEDDDDEGWITPSNIALAKKQIDSDILQDKPAKVACMTTDFAMQNVLMQIGLNVAALDGRVIKQMRTFIFRCIACFKTTSIMTKVFCPNCGTKNLKKVAVSLDDQGNQRIHINYRKKLTTRGKRFSLPTPHGGKHACYPILCQDQPVPDQRISKLARQKNNPLNDDYIAGYSPFVMRDVNSKSAMLGLRQDRSNLKYWMKKNPNESNRRRRK